MKKKYFSPSVKVFCVESSTLLAASGNVDVTVDGDKTEITDGGTTDPDENYNPW